MKIKPHPRAETLTITGDKGESLVWTTARTSPLGGGFLSKRSFPSQEDNAKD